MARCREGAWLQALTCGTPREARAEAMWCRSCFVALLVHVVRRFFYIWSAALLLCYRRIGPSLNQIAGPQASDSARCGVPEPPRTCASRRTIGDSYNAFASRSCLLVLWSGARRSLLVASCFAALCRGRAAQEARRDEAGIACGARDCCRHPLSLRRLGVGHPPSSQSCGRQSDRASVGGWFAERRRSGPQHACEGVWCRRLTKFFDGGLREHVSWGFRLGKLAAKAKRQAPPKMGSADGGCAVV